MPAEKPDLVVSDLAAAFPVRTLIINVADMHSSRLTLLEALDMMEASGLAPEDFTRVMDHGTMRQKAQMMYAMAWVIARRAEPDLTWAEVCTYRVEVRGERVDEDKAKYRADAIVGVASLAGVSTEDAKKMTVDEVTALNALHKRRHVKRQTPRRRKAG